MNHRDATRAALALLASAGLVAGVAVAAPDDGKDKEKPAPTTAEEQRRDDALKALEQGFSIPAADGAPSEAGTQKKSPPKK